jgi:A/G-specific adenine glycosylase
LDYAAIRKQLARWYRRNKRDLPWRRTSDPYAIWISEIMLQQTRVAAVIPYYERFLGRFPRPEDLALAPEAEVLAMWAGLGYYSRARNLQKAAGQIVEAGRFPRDYTGIQALSGVGDYTAAAVASIAFGLPYAAIDGNVRRVVCRLTGQPEPDMAREAAALLDRRQPGQSNQALMELGALVCLPREPRCGECPVKLVCAAHRLGRQAELPVPRKKTASVRRERTLLVIRRRGHILLIPSARVRGFWELPEPFEGARQGARLGSFRHAITTSQYLFEVREAKTAILPRGSQWWDESQLGKIPFSTASKKALRCLGPL